MGVPEAVVEAACLVLSLAAVLPLLTPGHLWAHDAGAHLFRLSEVARALSEGVLYPRFLPDAYGGLGGPILNFNPTAPYYLPALLVLAGIGPIAALKIAAGAAMIAGGLAVRVLARPHLGRAGAAVAGLAYVFLPYRIANLYVRMAYSELVAMVVLPLALAAARRAARSPSPRRIGAAGIALGLLPATHFPTSVLGVPLVLLYALASSRRGRRARGAASAAALLGVALAASAFAWLPALAEQGQTHYEESTAGYDHYGHHFLSWPQLLSVKWGFGPSMPGSCDQMSFQIGWAHLLGLGVSLAAAAARSARARPIALLCAAVAAVGSFLMLGPARPLWDRLPILQDVQFPWRFLGIVGLATSLAVGLAAALPGAPAGAAAGAASQPRRPWIVRTATAVMIVVVVGACVPYLKSRRGDGKDADFTPEAIRRQYFGELKFQPREVSALRFRPEGPRAALLGGGTASIVEERTHRTAVEVDAPAPATLRLHLFATPGWRAWSGGEELPLRAEAGTGLVLVEVPAGRRRVDLRFGNTPVRRAGWVLSAAGVLAGLGLILRGRAPGPASRPSARRRGG